MRKVDSGCGPSVVTNPLPSQNRGAEATRRAAAATSSSAPMGVATRMSEALASISGNAAPTAMAGGRATPGR